MKLRKEPNKSADKIWGLTRISLGLVFFGAFVDKLLGLGFNTCRDSTTGAVEVMCQSAWLSGGSPTSGFLQFGTSGPLAEFYQGLVGNLLVDWLFMLGMLGIGVALILGIGMLIAVVSGVLMMLMMYTAALPPEHNPVIDDHIIYALVLVGLLKQNATQCYGFGDRWKRTELVKKLPVFR